MFSSSSGMDGLTRLNPALSTFQCWVNLIPSQCSAVISNALGCTGIYSNRKEKTQQYNNSGKWLCFGWHSFVLWHHRTESMLALYSLGSCGWLHPSPGFWDYRSALTNLFHEASDTVPAKLHPLSQPQESFRFCEERLHGSPSWRG